MLPEAEWQLKRMTFLRTCLKNRTRQVLYYSQRVQSKILKSRDEASYSAACGIFEAFDEANNWNAPKPISVSGFAVVQNESIDDAIEKAASFSRLQYEAYKNQIMHNHAAASKMAAASSLASATASSFGYAILDADEKKEIHAHITKIRKLIDQSQLDDRKKNSLFERLTSLAMEVDRNGPGRMNSLRSQAKLPSRPGNFAKKAKPMFDEVKDILKIITRARARHDGISLPPGAEILSLPDQTD